MSAFIYIFPQIYEGSIKKDFVEGIDYVITIRNSKEKKWITLYQYSDTIGYNNTEETKEIIELTELLYEKYLEDNK